MHELPSTRYMHGMHVAACSMREAIAYTPDGLKRYMNFLTSMTGRIYCAAWQPLTSAKQESGSAKPSEVMLEGDSRSKACALATGVFRGSAATWAWWCAGRAARNATAAAELPSALPAEPLSAARGGEAKRSRASNRRCGLGLASERGRDAKARLLRR